jgi:carbamoylphosphate synthase large subunit
MGDVKNLLVTTAGGSGIYPIIESVKSSKYNINLVLVDASEIAGALYEVDKSYIIPPVNDKNYLCVLEKILKKEKIEYFISLLDEELIFLADKKIPAKTLIPKKESLINTWDKIKTYKKAKKFFAKTWILSNEVDLREIWKQNPILLKPALSRGGRGIIIPEDFEEFEFYAKRFIKKQIPYLIQKFVKGKEYNISTLHDKKGNLIYAISRWKFEKRVIKSGSKASVIEYNQKVIDFALDVLKELDLNYGFNNVEVIENSDGIFLLEVNGGRIAAQDMNIVKAGINVVDLFIDIVDEKEILPIKVNDGMCNIKTSRDIWVEFEKIEDKKRILDEYINSCGSPR